MLLLHLNAFLLLTERHRAAGIHPRLLWRLEQVGLQKSLRQVGLNLNFPVTICCFNACYEFCLFVVLILVMLLVWLFVLISEVFCAFRVADSETGMEMALELCKQEVAINFFYKRNWNKTKTK